MQTIGERLEEARKRKGISIREAAEATKIRGDYLHKYESNQFDIKLPEIYVRGFLRTYANYLKLSGDKIINDYHALGLGDAKNARPINREVYGRMDLSVAKTGTGGAEVPGGSHIAASGNTAQDNTPGDKNPATFRPRAPGGLNIDPDLLIKGAAVIAGLVVVILLAIWGFGAITKAKSAPAPDYTTWVKPQAGERTLGLVGVATGVDQVAVTDATGAVIYRGPVKANETRSVPRTGVVIIQTETPQNLMIEIDGKPYELKGKRSTVQAPSAR